MNAGRAKTTEILTDKEWQVRPGVPTIFKSVCMDLLEIFYTIERRF